MLALVSPAKKLDFSTPPPCDAYTQPMFQDQSQELIDVLKSFPKSRLKAMMDLSTKLTDLNYERYQNYHTPFTPDNAMQAIYAFRGDTYVGLDADSLSEDDIEYAQGHLGILSGMYGMLRPLDLMQPYRLEMGKKIPTSKGEDLYDVWGDVLAKTCNQLVQPHPNPAVICLASHEYIKAVSVKDLIGPFITCHFKQIKDGEPKVIGLFAKRARGMMARFMIQNRIENPEGLKAFDQDGYVFNPVLSSDTDFVFLRKT